DHQQRRGDHQPLAGGLLHIALVAFLGGTLLAWPLRRRGETRAGRRGGLGGRFGRTFLAPQLHRCSPSFLARISSIETAAPRPAFPGPEGAGASARAGRGGVVGPVVGFEEGAEAGEGLPASAATRPPPGNVDEGTSLPVRGGEGSGVSRRGGTDGF